MKRKIFTLLLATAAIVSCSKSDEPVTGGESSTKVTIDPMIQTRATELSFEENDEIGVSIVMSDDNSVYADNALLTYTDGSFSGNLTWYDNVLETSTVYAYYPYVIGESVPTTFTVQADQSTATGYTKSDLMIASKSDVTPTVAGTTMTFSHSLSRIVVTLDLST